MISNDEHSIPIKIKNNKKKKLLFFVDLLRKIKKTRQFKIKLPSGIVSSQVELVLSKCQLILIVVPDLVSRKRERNRYGVSRTMLNDN